MVIEPINLKEWSDKLEMTEIEVFKAIMTFLAIKAEAMGIPQKVICNFPRANLTR